MPRRPKPPEKVVVTLRFRRRIADFRNELPRQRVMSARKNRLQSGLQVRSASLVRRCR